MLLNTNNTTLKFKTKNDKDALIREYIPKDIREVVKVLIQASKETDNLIIDIEDLKDIDFEVEEFYAFMENTEENKDKIELVCELGGEIVGYLKIKFNEEVKIKHRATISLCVLKKYWNLGIGKTLISQAIKVAQDNQIEQLELKYIEGNTRANALYSKFGFYETGVIPNAVKSNNIYKNTILMFKQIKKGELL